MSRGLVIRQAAADELAQAFRWYEDQVPGLGDAFLVRVNEVFASICDHPGMYPVIHRQIRRALTRRFPYQILFVARDDQVVVLAVFHGTRDPRHWQSRL